MEKLKLTRDEIVLFSQFRPRLFVMNAVAWGMNNEDEERIKKLIKKLQNQDPVLAGERELFNYCHEWQYKDDDISPKMIEDWKKNIVNKGEPVEGEFEVVCGTSLERAKLWKEKRLGFVWSEHIVSKTGEGLGLQVACPTISKCRTESERLKYYAENQASRLGDVPVILKFKTNELYRQGNNGEFFVPRTAKCWDFSIQEV